MSKETTTYELAMPQAALAFWNAFFIILGLLFLFWAAKKVGVL